MVVIIVVVQSGKKQRRDHPDRERQEIASMYSVFSGSRTAGARSTGQAFHTARFGALDAGGGASGMVTAGLTEGG